MVYAYSDFLNVLQCQYGQILDRMYRRQNSVVAKNKKTNDALEIDARANNSSMYIDRCRLPIKMSKCQNTRIETNTSVAFKFLT